MACRWTSAFIRGLLAAHLLSDTHFVPPWRRPPSGSATASIRYVAERIRLFYDRYPTGRIVTHLVRQTDADVTVRAEVYRTPTEREPAPRDGPRNASATATSTPWYVSRTRRRPRSDAPWRISGSPRRATGRAARRWKRRIALALGSAGRPSRRPGTCGRRPRTAPRRSRRRSVSMRGTRHTMRRARWNAGCFRKGRCLADSVLIAGTLSTSSCNDDVVSAECFVRIERSHRIAALLAQPLRHLLSTVLPSIAFFRTPESRVVG